MDYINTYIKGEKDMFNLDNEIMDTIEKENAKNTFIVDLKKNICVNVSACSVCKNGCKGACKTTCSNNITGKRGN